MELDATESLLRCFEGPSKHPLPPPPPPPQKRLFNVLKAINQLTMLLDYYRKKNKQEQGEGGKGGGGAAGLKDVEFPRVSKK